MRNLSHDLIAETIPELYGASHAGSLPLKLAYDYEVDARGDPLIQKVEESMAVLAQIMIPGRFLVNSYPFCEYLPLDIGQRLSSEHTLTFRHHMPHISSSEPYPRMATRNFRFQGVCQEL